MVPVHTFVNGVSVWSRVLVIQNPVERHDRGIEFAHEVLADVIHTMLVVSLVHLGYVGFLSSNLGQNIDVVILPYVVQAMNGMSTHCGRKISSSYIFGVLDCCQVMANSSNVIC